MPGPEALVYEERPAPPSISELVECAWRIEAQGPGPVDPHRVLPDGCVELIVQLEGRVVERRAGSGEALQPRTRVVGQLDRYLLLQPQGRSHTVGVRLRPAATGPFLGVRAAELTGETFEAGAVLGDRRMFELRAAAESTEPLRAVLELCHRWSGSTRRLDDRVSRAVRLLLGSRGCMRMGELHERLGIQARTLQRRFGACVGLQPKQLARIARLQSVLLGFRQRVPELAEIALESGYADQAHLTREFKELTGLTPGAWRKSGHAFADLFSGRERLTNMLRRSGPLG